MSIQDKSPKPDITELMEKIRSKVKAELVANKDKPLSFKPKVLDFNEGNTSKGGELVNSEDLRFLNHNYVMGNLLNPENFVTHRKGILGRLIIFFKRKFAIFLKESILKYYLEHQQQFFIHLVRYLNKTSSYVDSRDGDIFWQLIHKIDTDVGKSNERIERIRDEVLGAAQSAERNSHQAIQETMAQVNQTLGNILSGQQQQKNSLSTMDSVVRGLEGIVAQIGKANNLVASQASEINLPDQTYVLLENRFRGSQEEIRARQEMYAEYFSSASKPILDVGCGRGELLSILRDKGIPSQGIDMDPAMIQHSRDKGLNVEEADLISYLRKAEDQSFGGLIALQVVEHLPRNILNEFVELAKRKVVRGGLIILETINPTSMTALSSNYFRDPTHVFPQHPDTLGFLMTATGLDLLETKYLAEIPKEAQLRELKQEAFMTPRWSEMINLFNHNIKLLNSVLFGFQDYCVVAKVR